MLAYVQWNCNPQFSKFGPLKFRDLGSFEVINVSTIDRNVGFLKMPNNETHNNGSLTDAALIGEDYHKIMLNPVIHRNFGINIPGNWIT
ncbi:296_t:CDS:2, partial [Dentiscutata heterogama]